MTFEERFGFFDNEIKSLYVSLVGVKGIGLCRILGGVGFSLGV